MKRANIRLCCCILYFGKLLTMPSHKKTNEHATVFGWHADACFSYAFGICVCVCVCILSQTTQRSQSYSILLGSNELTEKLLFTNDENALSLKCHCDI